MCLLFQMLWFKLDWCSSWSGDTWSSLLSCMVLTSFICIYFLTYFTYLEAKEIILEGFGWGVVNLLERCTAKVPACVSCVQLAFFTTKKVRAFQELTWVSRLIVWKKNCFLEFLSLKLELQMVVSLVCLTIFGSNLLKEMKNWWP